MTYRLYLELENLSTWFKVNILNNAPIFNKLKVLTVFDINKLQTACFSLCLKFSVSNYQVTLMITLYQIVPY